MVIHYGKFLASVSDLPLLSVMGVFSQLVCVIVGSDHSVNILLGVISTSSHSNQLVDWVQHLAFLPQTRWEKSQN